MGYNIEYTARLQTELYSNILSQLNKGWGIAQLTVYLLSMRKTLGSIPSSEGKKMGMGLDTVLIHWGGGCLWGKEEY